MKYCRTWTLRDAYKALDESAPLGLTPSTLHELIACNLSSLGKTKDDHGMYIMSSPGVGKKLNKLVGYIPPRSYKTVSQALRNTFWYTNL